MVWRSRLAKIALSEKWFWDLSINEFYLKNSRRLNIPFSFVYDTNNDDNVISF